MEYISTRGSAPAISSKKAILKGIAEDKGLYVPSHLPHLGVDPFAGIEEDAYAERALKILAAFSPGLFSGGPCARPAKRPMRGILIRPQTAPIRFLNDGTAVLELWHGPTQAFKDMALQIMPRLLSTALQGEKERYELVILVATSGRYRQGGPGRLCRRTGGADFRLLSPRRGQQNSTPANGHAAGKKRGRLRGTREF